MKYLCLVYGEEDAMAGVDDAECMACSEALDAQRMRLAAEALQPVRTATTVRVRDGRVSLSDGPFAETKEQLAGFYLLEAADLDEALSAAAKIPAARVGCVEVRPVRTLGA